jgi:drug/metabolite transporter (DMT)-like permease
MSRPGDGSRRGIAVTLLSTLFSGLAPILGKLAYQVGVSPTALVALRTGLAAGMLWLFYLACWRRYLAIGRANLLACIGMGVANGIGSLLYYNGLSRVDASVAHLLYSMYPFWVFIFLSAAGHPVSRLAVLRLILALASVFLLTWQGAGLVDPLGVTLMIGAGALYGFHLVLGQWTLVDVDPRTVTLYGLSTMAVVVFVPFSGQVESAASIPAAGWLAIVLLALFPTAIARLLVFAGLQRLGGMQTALLGLGETLVAVSLAFLLLGERFAPQQWLGAALFVVSVLLIQRDSGIEIAGEQSGWAGLYPGDLPEGHDL